MEGCGLSNIVILMKMEKLNALNIEKLITLT